MTGKLISPSGTSSTESKIPKGKDIEDLFDKLIRNIYEGTSNLRFRPDIENNSFY